MSSKLIQDILQVTDDPNNVPTNYTLIESENGPVTGFEASNIDSLLLTQLTENLTIKEPFTYLNECFQRCQRLKRINKGDQSLAQLFQETDRLVIGYGLVAFQIQDFAVNGSAKQYVVNIINSIDNYTDFLSQIIQRAIIEESIIDLLDNVFPTLVDYLIKDLPNFDLNDSQTYNNVLTLFELFLNFKPVAAVFTKVEGFLPTGDCKGNLYEKVTTLGPILTLSPLLFNVALKNYGELLERTKQQTTIIHESLQAEHRVVIDRLFFILDRIIRGSLESRTDMISYLAQIVNKNHLRRADHAEQNKLATNAFMTNITLLLIRFSQPFLDVSYSKIDKIDVNYFNNISVFIDLSNETRLNSDFKEADEFYDKNKSSKDSRPNFISDCFFLTLAYLHYGIGGTLLYDEKLGPQIKRIKSELEKVKGFAQSNSFMTNFVNVQLKQLEKSLKYTTSIRDAMKGFFAHRSIQLEVFDFVCGASTFLMRVIDPKHEFPFKPISLPLIPDQVGVENVDNADYLRAHAPVPFKYYPEFVVEGPLNYALYISHYGGSPLFRNPRLHSFVEFGTTILRCPELVSNPHLKGKLVQLLSVGALPLTDNSPGFMVHIFEENELVSKHLLYALLDFYVIVEKTGSSSQFYDKFNSRYSISIILEALYTDSSVYKRQLIWQSQNNPDFFIRFVARMLNDLTFLLDEGLSSLSDVHNLNNELRERAAAAPLPSTDANEPDTAELQSRLSAAQRQAKSSCGLAAKSVELFQNFTKDIPGAFATPELVDRLATMLNYNLQSLVGPKCGELKVDNPAQYSFNPKELLKALCTVYINLSVQDEFLSAVARDTRSFNVDLFKKATIILGMKTGLVTGEFCDQLVQFAQKAQEKKDEVAEEDLEYGDAPDEFLDPLMFTLMKDPVTLPASKVNIDRSTIKAHLLSDSTDPFNRMPLKLDDVIPNPELKEKIIAFKQQKKLERQQEQAQ
ncbi:ubiquitin-ubiquitin ligase UFD2 KNAG_0B02850 [Huiozyma naganishii CBS 8797]|uniref:RING-type E3 ubiquitin transferase n=1 Tax=Huiozyma naganishii (strain ATCC MYA-139 / BCRC 22969 / CBS 8797 / KCTC 17520 / NBRC 10181 / NCYC 3082 / Yp74L-3) TaxID=1071383 RepID=J7RV10_HUIN7|nr:hypothetical protein KNAG_0B02850 [Kazachstania naganishii CBS 8797]CCK68727.1 hypothetical protein KNAG_0B02850 [Kazachstania naganishii CBS 8797]